jgi:hypothetical protein
MNSKERAQTIQNSRQYDAHSLCRYEIEVLALRRLPVNVMLKQRFILTRRFAAHLIHTKPESDIIWKPYKQ